MKHPIKTLLYVVGALALLLLLFAVTLQFWAKGFINSKLENLDGFTGEITELDIDLWRGAYQVGGLTLDKVDDKVREPFVQIKEIDLSVQWWALLHGRIVAEIRVDQPELVFAPTQSGEGVDWLEVVKSFSPIDISKFEVNDAKISYVNRSVQPEIDLYLHHLNLKIFDISNVESKDKALPSEIYLDGTTIGNGRITVEGKFNILEKTPDFDLGLTYEDADLTYFNDYFKEFASLDFSEGTVNVYGELAAVNGKATGYVKPVIQHLEILDFDQDQAPLSILWEGLAGFFLEIFENQSKDQFALRIPLEGELTDPNQDLATAAYTVVKNAWIQALNPDVDGRVNFKDVVQKYGIEE